MFSGEAGGCGSFLVYRFNDGRMLAITVRVDEDGLVLSSEPTRVEIAPSNKSLAVEILQFASPVNAYFCDDVGGDQEPMARWSGRGRVDCHRPQGGAAAVRVQECDS